MQMPDFSFARKDFPLAPHTWYRVGGPADLALVPTNRKECIEAAEWMFHQEVPFLILGGGTNVLISDKGFRGIVLITTGLKGCEELDTHRHYADSGLLLDQLVREVMLRQNFRGVGALAGIPGSTGGAIYMNAGTANGSICEMLESVDLLRMSGLERVEVLPDSYAYRHQDFCHYGDLILGATFRFEIADKDQRAVYGHYIERRSLNQPRGHCCGSVFKNPPDDHAGRLIEACGLKGMRTGGAIVSPMHANFIMNESQASFDTILSLMRTCRDAVEKRTGIRLEPEVRIIGETGPQSL